MTKVHRDEQYHVLGTTRKLKFLPNGDDGLITT